MPYEKSQEVDAKDPVKLFKQNLEEAEGYRKKLEDSWVEQENMYEGRHWKNATGRYKTNLIFSAVEGLIPLILDGRPGITTLALDGDEDNKELASELSAANEFVQYKNKLGLVLEEAVRQAVIADTGYLYVYYDADAGNGDGRIKITSLPWRQVYLDPADEDTYTILRIPKRIESIKRMFPDKEDEIIANYDKNNYGASGSQYFPDPSKPRPESGEDLESVPDLKGTGTLDIMWCKDYTMENTPEEELQEEIERERDALSRGEVVEVNKYENHDGHIEDHENLKYEIIRQVLNIPRENINVNVIEEIKANVPEIAVLLNIIDDHIASHRAFKDQNPKGQRPKYKGFNRYIILNGKTVLYDGNYDVDKCPVPLVKIFLKKDSKGPYGKSEIKQVIDQQKQYNELDWDEFSNLRLVGNSGWVKDDSSEVDEETLTNAPGIVVTKKQGSEVQRLPPGQVSPQFQVKKNEIRQTIELILGVTEVSRGVNPIGVTSGDQYEALRDQALTRARLKIDRLNEYSMVMLGEIINRFIQHYWSGEKKIRLLSENGEYTPKSINSDALKDLDFEVRSVPDNTAGMDKGKIQQTYKELLLAGLISKKLYFKIVDVPYKSEILKEIEEEEAMAAEQAMLEQQAQMEQMALQEGQGITPEEMQLIQGV